MAGYATINDSPAERGVQSLAAKKRKLWTATHCEVSSCAPLSFKFFFAFAVSIQNTSDMKREQRTEAKKDKHVCNSIFMALVTAFKILRPISVRHERESFCDVCMGVPELQGTTFRLWLRCITVCWVWGVCHWMPNESFLSVRLCRQLRFSPMSFALLAEYHKRQKLSVKCKP